MIFLINKELAKKISKIPWTPVGEIFARLHLNFLIESTDAKATTSENLVVVCTPYFLLTISCIIAVYMEQLFKRSTVYLGLSEPTK